MGSNDVQIRLINSEKGKGLFAVRSFKDGDTILEEKPIICCQFAWNLDYGYLACDTCLKPLETAEENNVHNVALSTAASNVKTKPTRGNITTIPVSYSFLNNRIALQKFLNLYTRKVLIRLRIFPRTNSFENTRRRGQAKQKLSLPSTCNTCSSPVNNIPSNC